MFAKKALAASVSAGPKTYVEDVFSTYLYTGNGSTQTITNNIDLSGEGGLVWTKARSAAQNHFLTDSQVGLNAYRNSNTTSADVTYTSIGYTAPVFSTTGYTTSQVTSSNGTTYASWTFRKAKKFFDVVTYTGNGSNRTISHNLGSVPGCIIVKRTDTAASWRVYHRGLTDASYFLSLNLTDGQTSAGSIWNSTAPTSTVFSVGTSTTVNASGGTYVAYLFAHDAGGFGDAGDQSVIKCGSYTGNGSTTGPTIDLGWEPQWVLIKQSTNAGTRWTITDNMRGFPVTSAAQQQILQPNVTDAEVGVMYIQPTATGFKVVDVDGDVNTNGQTYIYIAIRRGPMKTPTVGTEVFNPDIGANVTSPPAVDFDAPFPADMLMQQSRSSGAGAYVHSRLTGAPNYLMTTSTNVEATSGSGYALDHMTGMWMTTVKDDSARIGWVFRRAPGFFDVVCYTGTGSARTVSHNLGVTPELMIVKNRGAAESWCVYTATTGNTKYLRLNSEGAASTSSTRWNDTSPTSSVFTVGTDAEVNASGNTYVTYLFASVTGVSKVFSYTGNGSNQTINCGFTAGARFVLIKRTDDNPATSDWYVWDSARGIVSGNDPFLRLNETTAEVTTDDSIDTDNTGFVVNQNSTTNININAATYIGLAIA